MNREPAVFTNQNFTESAPSFVAGDVLEDCNCSQSEAHTAFGVPGMRFVRCNLTNCDVPEDNEKVDCLSCHFIDIFLDEVDADELETFEVGPSQIIKYIPATGTLGLYFREVERGN